MNILLSLLIPLQVSLSDINTRTNSANSQNMKLFAVGIGIIVVFLVILNLARKKSGSKSGGHHLTGAGPRHFSSFTLHRLTNNMGFDREQVRMLEYVLRSGGVQDPESFLNSPAQIDRQFKRTYKLIERTAANDEERSSRLSTLFTTRNKIEAYSGDDTPAKSTRQVPEKTSAVLTFDKVSYPVQIISARGSDMVIESPKRGTGTSIHVSKGAKVKLAFFAKSSKGFSIETSVLGTENSLHGPILHLAHTDQIKKLSNRRYRRRQTIISTAFYMVSIENKKMIVDRKRYTGNIQDISAGGCSLKTNVSLNSGQRLKIEFTHDDNSVIAALGEVVRVGRTGAGTVMHIKFLKVPRKALNTINAVVYEYAD